MSEATNIAMEARAKAHAARLEAESAVLVAQHADKTAQECLRAMYDIGERTKTLRSRLLWLLRGD